MRIHLTSLLALFAGVGVVGCGDSGTTTSSGSGGTSQTGSTTASHASSTGTSSTASSSSTTTGSTTASASSTGSTSSTGTGGMAMAECTMTSDCKLEDDCCACAGYPVSKPPAACPLTCVISSCAADQYAQTLACSLGRCVAGFACDTSKAACAQPAPVCGAGKTNSVVNGCWGACVPADQCASVHDCSQCGANQACVFYGGGLKSYHCVDIPTVCGATATCACMGQSLCGGVPCADGGTNKLTCQAP